VESGRYDVLARRTESGLAKLIAGERNVREAGGAGSPSGQPPAFVRLGSDQGEDRPHDDQQQR
jgi:hypothetical protein